MMDRLFLLLAGGFKDPSQYSSQPQQVTPEEAAQHLIGCKKITILAGDGISTASEEQKSDAETNLGFKAIAKFEEYCLNTAEMESFLVT